MSTYYRNNKEYNKMVQQLGSKNIKDLKWFVTIKDVHNDCNPTLEDYAECVKDIYTLNKATVQEWAYETDSHNVLHLHLIVIGKCNFLQLRKRHPFSIHFFKIRRDIDERRCQNYIAKQNLNPYEIDQNNYIRHCSLYYPFIN